MSYQQLVIWLESKSIYTYLMSDEQNKEADVVKPVSVDNSVDTVDNAKGDCLDCSRAGVGEACGSCDKVCVK